MDKQSIKSIAVVSPAILMIMIIGILLLNGPIFPYTGNTTNTTGMPSTSDTTPFFSENNMTDQQKNALSLVLNDTRVTSMLNGRSYFITGVRIDGATVDDKPFTYVQFYVKNDDGSLYGYSTSLVDLKNNSVIMVVNDLAPPTLSH